MRKFFMVLILCMTSNGAFADCFDIAAHKHRVNPWILRAIAHVESGFNSSAVNHNSNGTIDVGMMQTNSIHFTRLRRFGIQREHLFDACTSIHVAAAMLRENINNYGNTWQAVGAYHSRTPKLRDRYAKKVRDIISIWSRTYFIE